MTQVVTQHNVCRRPCQALNLSIKLWIWNIFWYILHVYFLFKFLKHSKAKFEMTKLSWHLWINIKLYTVTYYLCFMVNYINIVYTKNYTFIYKSIKLSVAKKRTRVVIWYCYACIGVFTFRAAAFVTQLVTNRKL